MGIASFVHRGKLTRRALITGGAVAAAGIAADAVARPLPAEAANGDNLVVGQINTASAVTTLREDQSSYALEAISDQLSSTAVHVQAPHAGGGSAQRATTA